MKKIVTVGTFDGVHLGHQLVIDALTEEARNKSLEPLVLTFDRHPLETIAPHRAPGLLMDSESKADYFKSIGLEMQSLPFDAVLAKLTVDEWFARLVADYQAAAVVVGYDNTFGSDGLQMSIAQYREIADRHGLALIEAQQLPAVSSTAIRRAVAEGRLEDAAGMLGRPYAITGQVVHGLGNGRKIGFPTANIRPSYRAVLPPDGVYYGEAISQSLPSGKIPAVVNIGTHPTIDQTAAPVIEAHFPGIDADLYGAEIRLSLIRKIRDEKHFANLDELKEAIRKDIERINEK